jgi:hypothetical protein
VDSVNELALRDTLKDIGVNRNIKSVEILPSDDASTAENEPE